MPILFRSGATSSASTPRQPTSLDTADQLRIQRTSRRTAASTWAAKTTFAATTSARFLRLLLFRKPPRRRSSITILPLGAPFGLFRSPRLPLLLLCRGATFAPPETSHTAF